MKDYEFKPWTDDEQQWIADHSEQIKKYISFPVKINNIRHIQSMIAAHGEEAQKKLAALGRNKNKMLQAQFTAYINACGVLNELIGDYAGSIYQEVVNEEIKQAEEVVDNGQESDA